MSIEGYLRTIIVSGGAFMSGRSSICRIRNGLATGVIALGLLAGCNSFDSRASGALDSFSAQQIFERGEFELERSQPTMRRSISVRLNVFTPIPNGPNAR